MESRSTTCRKYTSWPPGAPHTLSADRRHRKQGPCQALGCLELPSTCSHARWALTKYASIGYPEGLIRKQQKHLAPRMAWGRNNCKQSRGRLALLCPGRNGSGEETAAGRLLGFIPSWLLIPRCWVTTCGGADVCPLDVWPLPLSPSVPAPSTGFIDSFIDDVGA